MIPREHSSLFEAKLVPLSCTFEGMRQSLKVQAAKVEVNGAFFFHFSGHGVKVGNGRLRLHCRNVHHCERVEPMSAGEWLQS